MARRSSKRSSGNAVQLTFFWDTIPEDDVNVEATVSGLQAELTKENDGELLLRRYDTEVLHGLPTGDDAQVSTESTDTGLRAGSDTDRTILAGEPTRIDTGSDTATYGDARDNREPEAEANGYSDSGILTDTDGTRRERSDNGRDIRHGEDALSATGGSIIRLGESRSALENRQLTGTASRFDPTSDHASPFATGALVSRIKRNTSIIALLRILDEEQRYATPEEQSLLAQWSGWGSIGVMFDSTDPAVVDARDSLVNLLSEDDLLSAKRATPNAHYTDPVIIKNLWQSLPRLGVRDGVVLEPGCGSGHFIGYSPSDITMIGVELDNTTSRIAQYLYPSDQILNMSYGDFAPPVPVLAAIGNVPFGDYKIDDPVFNPDEFSIHNHFINKAIHQVQPGGIVAMVTSRYTMDSQSTGARRRFIEDADFLGAVRLPDMAHQRTAMTSVVSDILIFRRRVPSEAEVDSPAMDLAKPMQLGDESVLINEYFHDHPEQILGTLEVRQGMYSATTLHVDFDGGKSYDDLDLRLSEALDRIVSRAVTYGLTSTPAEIPTLDAFREAHQEIQLDLHTPRRIPFVVGALYYDASTDTIRVCESRNGANREWKPSETITETDETGKVTRRRIANDFPASDRAELLALLEMRDLTVQILEKQREPYVVDAALAPLQALLSDRYAAYVSKYGYIGRYEVIKTQVPDRSVVVSDEDSADIDAALEQTADPIIRRRKKYPSMGRFRSDPFFYLVATTVENFDDITLTATPGPALSERIARPTMEVLSAESPRDAYLLSLNYFNTVDIEYIAYLLGMDKEDAITALGDLVFRNPENPESLVASHIYLSGNVRTKYVIAQEAAQRDPRFERNVKALEPVLPPLLSVTDISLQLGSPVVPTDVYERFIDHMSNSSSSCTVKYHAPGLWQLDNIHSYSSRWSTDDRSFASLITSIFNQRPITVTKQDGNGGSYVDQVATLAAQEIAQSIKDEFDRWWRSDSDAAEAILASYNLRFNNVVPVDYSFEAPPIPHIANTFVPLPHQRIGVSRILVEPSAVLAHDVGAGKTATMLMAAMELKRLGMAKRPLFVVPNHMLDAFAMEAQRIYPFINILVGHRDRYQGVDGRREFISKAVAGEWDLLIIGHSMFRQIPLSDQALDNYVYTESETLRETLTQMCGPDAEQTSSTKQLEKRIQSQISTLTKAARKLAGHTTSGVCFDDLGADALFVDESHIYKNLGTVSNIQSAAIPYKQVTLDLHSKLSYLRQRNSGVRVVFASATPIANSITEVHALLRYMAPEMLEETGMTAFDSWAATFGSVIPILELRPEGGSYRVADRFAQFNNIPELRRLLACVVDVKRKEDLGLSLPRMTNDSMSTIVIPRPPSLATFIESLGDRAEDVRRGKVDPTEDNMLLISTDGRKASLSMKLVDPEYEVEDPSTEKLAVAASHIAEIYHAHKNDVYFHDRTGVQSEITGVCQIVFSDLGTPSDASSWNAYDELRNYLVAKGVPRHMVRFIHEANTDQDKHELFEACRTGQVAVLVGSTGKLGIGTNVQTRLKALHNLDCPWRPADLQQRIGRIIRQGNQNAEVDIYNYVTEGSFDTYTWQTVERKARFIQSLMSHDGSNREIEDIGEEALSYSEIKALASGDPLVMEIATTTATFARIDKKHTNYNLMLNGYSTKLAHLREVVKMNATRIESAKALKAIAVPTHGDAFTAEVVSVSQSHGTVWSRPADAEPTFIKYTSRASAATALASLLIDIKDKYLLTYADAFKVGNISLSIDMKYKHGMGYVYTFHTPDNVISIVDETINSHMRSTRDPQELTSYCSNSLLRKLENAVNGIDFYITHHTKLNVAHAETIAELQSLIVAPFPGQAEWDELSQRLEELRRQALTRPDLDANDPDVDDEIADELSQELDTTHPVAASASISD